MRRYSGLTDQQVHTLRQQHGMNLIATKSEGNLLTLFLSQFKNPLVYILALVSLVTFYLMEFADTVMILTVVMINAVIGTIQEVKAKNTLTSLKQLLSPQAKVYRNGTLVSLPAQELVPGDILTIEAGDRVPADGKLLDAANLQIDESQLTGESYPVDKDVQENSTVFMASIVTNGRGVLEVTTIGPATAVGQISQSVVSNISQPTPLEKKFAILSRQIMIVVVIICFVIFLLGIFREFSMEEMFKVGVSLGVSAVPEGLPIVVTVTLAIGAYRMSQKRVVIRNLPSVSTLAGVDIICTDKTGTITEGKVELVEAFVFQKHQLISGMTVHLLELAALCNDAQVGAKKLGDLLDVAILNQAERVQINIEKLRNTYERIDELPFDSSLKYQATLHRTSAKQNMIIVKGAFEQLLPLCGAKNSVSQKLLATKAQELARQGFKVLLLSTKMTADTKLAPEKITDLHCEGLLVFLDPLRTDVASAVHACRRAGVDVLMITGDHLETAKTIAREAGIYQEGDLAVDSRNFQKNLQGLINEEKLRVIARATPLDKSLLIELLKKNHHSIAMTGDGVNDAPALAQADIGIAMGVIGTDAARETADMVLLDDKFSTIVHGIFEARGVFENIRKVINYLFTTSYGEIFVILVGMLFGLPLPLTAVQILWMNLVTDGLLDVSIATEANREDVLNAPHQRYRGSVIDGLLFFRIVLLGSIMGLGSLWLFAHELQDHGLAYARTACLIVLAMYQWFHAFNARSEDQSLLNIGIFRNRAVLLALCILIFVTILAVYNPLMHSLLGTQSVGLEIWMKSALLTAPIILIEEGRKWIFRKYNLSRYFHSYART